MPSLPANMKVLLILVENSWKAEMKFFPLWVSFSRKLELVSNILWITADHLKQQKAVPEECSYNTMDNFSFDVSKVMASVDFTIDQNTIRRFTCDLIYKIKVEIHIKGPAWQFIVFSVLLNLVERGLHLGNRRYSLVNNENY